LGSAIPWHSGALEHRPLREEVLWPAVAPGARSWAAEVPAFGAGTRLGLRRRVCCSRPPESAAGGCPVVGSDPPVAVAPVEIIRRRRRRRLTAAEQISNRASKAADRRQRVIVTPFLPWWVVALIAKYRRYSYPTAIDTQERNAHARDKPQDTCGHATKHIEAHCSTAKGEDEKRC